MTAAAADILIFGFGNPGRADDGLGPTLAEIIEERDLPGVTIESDYQLTVEDAALVADHKIVLFADAAIEGAEPFFVRRLFPQQNGVGFSSHGVEPGGVLALARELFNAEPTSYLLGIRGYEFDEFRTDLSEQAQKNLDAAVDYVVSAIQEGSFQELNTDSGEADSQQDSNKAV
jgi:hydrogenase maturation protease